MRLAAPALQPIASVGDHAAAAASDDTAAQDTAAAAGWPLTPLYAPLHDAACLRVRSSVRHDQTPPLVLPPAAGEAVQLLFLCEHGEQNDVTAATWRWLALAQRHAPATGLQWPRSHPLPLAWHAVVHLGGGGGLGAQWRDQVMHAGEVLGLVTNGRTAAEAGEGSPIAALVRNAVMRAGAAALCDWLGRGVEAACGVSPLLPPAACFAEDAALRCHPLSGAHEGLETDCRDALAADAAELMLGGEPETDSAEPLGGADRLLAQLASEPARSYIRHVGSVAVLSLSLGERVRPRACTASTRVSRHAPQTQRLRDLLRTLPQLPSALVVATPLPLACLVWRGEVAAGATDALHDRSQRGAEEVWGLWARTAINTVAKWAQRHYATHRVILISGVASEQPQHPCAVEWRWPLQAQLICLRGEGTLRMATVAALDSPLVTNGHRIGEVARSLALGEGMALRAIAQRAPSQPAAGGCALLRVEPATDARECPYVMHGIEAAPERPQLVVRAAPRARTLACPSLTHAL